MDALLGQSVRAIRLNGDLLRTCSEEEIRRRLVRILGSNRFSVDFGEGALRILGPDFQYHAADPYLAEGLQALDLRHGDDMTKWRADRNGLAVCLEDCWSGWFLAEHLDRLPRGDRMVLIHLDDHTDMMPARLTPTGEGLVDAITGRAFDPGKGSDWEASIASGGVGIGSFLTPFFHSGRLIELRHLNNFRNCHYRRYNAVRAFDCHELLPDLPLAAVRKRPADWERSAGSYLGGSGPARVLASLPDGPVFVHIDLDYFINDYNGNLGVNARPPYLSTPMAVERLDAFFAAVARSGRRVERWIVATSPGFCSGRHWAWLLDEIARRAERLEQVH